MELFVSSVQRQRDKLSFLIYKLFPFIDFSAVTSCFMSLPHLVSEILDCTLPQFVLFFSL